MNAEQLIKKAIILRTIEMGYCTLEDRVNITEDNIEDIWDDCDYYDAMYELRGGEVETNIEAPYSRYYESRSVAACVDGEWVGWTYWYGGGKHGDPEAIDWVNYAYKLDCKEEQKVVTVRTFEVKQ